VVITCRWVSLDDRSGHDRGIGWYADSSSAGPYGGSSIVGSCDGWDINWCGDSSDAGSCRGRDINWFGDSSASESSDNRDINWFGIHRLRDVGTIGTLIVVGYSPVCEFDLFSISSDRHVLDISPDCSKRPVVWLLNRSFYSIISNEYRACSVE